MGSKLTFFIYLIEFTCVIYSDIQNSPGNHLNPKQKLCLRVSNKIIHRSNFTQIPDCCQPKYPLLLPPPHTPPWRVSVCRKEKCACALNCNINICLTLKRVYFCSPPKKVKISPEKVIKTKKIFLKQPRNNWQNMPWPIK